MRDSKGERMDRSKVRFVVVLGLLLAVAGGATARATDGSPLLIGQSNAGTSTTEIDDTTQGDVALRGASDGGTAVDGKDVTGTGIEGITSTGIGVHAISGPDTGTALQADGAVALLGSTLIDGETDVTGPTTLRGTTTLRGSVVMKRSGAVTVRAGHVARTVSDVQMSGNSMVFAVAQQRSRGVFVVAAVPTEAGFTVFLNEPSPRDLRVAWMVIG